MKILCCLLMVMAALSGCSRENTPLSGALEFRELLLSSNGCRFSSEVTADYGDSLTQFTMECEADGAGNLEFEIMQPETIAGIRGTISDQGGNIRFDEQFLYFPLMTDDLLTPASSPWIFLRTLRSGYITSACMEENMLHMTVDDDYAEDALTLDIWLENHQPVRAEILHDGKRILTVAVENFVLL